MGQSRSDYISSLRDPSLYGIDRPMGMENALFLTSEAVPPTQQMQK